MGRSKAKPTSFLRKTYEMLENPALHDIVRWSEDGLSFLVVSVNDFCSQVLSVYFKHSNFASYVRQLNMYGFHKLKVEGVNHAFQQPMFKKDAPQLLGKIRRKRLESVESLIPTVQPSDEASSLKRIKRQYRSLKQETAQLRQELLSLTIQSQQILQEMNISRNREANYRGALASLMDWLQSKQDCLPYDLYDLRTSLPETDLRLSLTDSLEVCEAFDQSTIDSDFRLPFSQLTSRSESCAPSDLEYLRVLLCPEELDTLDELLLNSDELSNLSIKRD
jgi:hypothetical protein